MGAAAVTKTGGEALVDALKRHEVETLFCLPGVQNDWFFNALHDHGQAIRVVHTRHEQGAGYMALGAALATGGVGAFSVVPGPGLLNATAALATGYALNARMLCLSGQIPLGDIGRDYGHLHEIPDQLTTLRSLTRWAERARSPAEIPGLVDQAFDELHRGRPRPVALEVPMDVLAASTAVAEPEAPWTPPAPPPVTGAAIDEAAALLDGAERPIVFVGSGAMAASAEVRALVDFLQAPVVAYRTGKGVVDDRSHLSIQLPAARALWNEADAVLAIGSNLRTPLMKWANDHMPPMVRIDVDPETHHRIRRTRVAITARAEEAVPALLERLRALGTARESRADELEAHKARWREEVSVLTPQVEFLAAIRGAIGEEGIFVDELTQVGFASRIAWEASTPRTFLSTGYQGTLGYGFPTGLGAKVARPDVPVVSITGDGGFLFGVQELATAVQHQIGLVTVVFNNDQYGNVQQMQKSDYGGRVIASDLVNPDFVAMARSFGAEAERVTTPEALQTAIAAAAGRRLPTVIEVPVGDMPSADRFR